MLPLATDGWMMSSNLKKAECGCVEPSISFAQSVNGALQRNTATFRF